MHFIPFLPGLYLALGEQESRVDRFSLPAGRGLTSVVLLEVPDALNGLVVLPAFCPASGNEERERANKKICQVGADVTGGGCPMNVIIVS